LRTWGEHHYTIEKLIAEDDQVMALVTLEATHTGEPDMPVYQGSLSGHEPTGRSIKVQHVHVFRIAGGKIVEHWGIRDDLGMLRQLGLT
jgi:predicted ester cyclase